MVSPQVKLMYTLGRLYLSKTQCGNKQCRVCEAFQAGTKSQSAASVPSSPQQFSIKKERLLDLPLTLEGKYLLSIKYLVRHNLLVRIGYHFLLSLACGRKDFYLQLVVHSVKCFFYNNLDDDIIA